MIKDRSMTSNHSNPIANIVCVSALVIATFLRSARPFPSSGAIEE